MPKPILRPVTKPATAPREIVVTAQDFSGGWNVVDTDLLLSSKFAKVFENFVVGKDTAPAIRPGTKHYCTFGNPATADIDVAQISYPNLVHIQAADNTIIGFHTDGTISRVITTTGPSSMEIIWNETKSQATDTTAKWGATTFVSTEFFGSKLYASNGVNKPVEIDWSATSDEVQYLIDAVDGNNTNVPIGEFMRRCDQYMVISGISGSPHLLAISSARSPGTYLGASDPNDAVNFDLGLYAAVRDPKIRGLLSADNRLFVLYDSQVVVLVLGEYDDTGNHIPRVENIYDGYGVAGHHLSTQLADRVFLFGPTNVSTSSRNTLTNRLSIEDISVLVWPEMQKTLYETAISTTALYGFSAASGAENLILFSLPTADSPTVETLVDIFALRYSRELKLTAWSRFVGLKGIRSATVDRNGIVFLAYQNSLLVLGSTLDPVHQDYEDWFGYYWQNSQSYTVGMLVATELGGDVYCCLVNHTSHASNTFTQDRTNNPTYWELVPAGTGEPIEFDWLFPWSHLGHPGDIKYLRSLRLNTTGDASFTLEVYVDYHTEPNAVIEFVGGDVDSEGTLPLPPFGTGRIASDQRTFAVHSKGKVFRFRLKGSATKPLTVVSLEPGFLKGNKFR